jgi:hypothetical protein
MSPAPSGCSRCAQESFRSSRPTTRSRWPRSSSAAGEGRRAHAYEFQRLHGMGEALYDTLIEIFPAPPAGFTRRSAGTATSSPIWSAAARERRQLLLRLGGGRPERAGRTLLRRPPTSSSGRRRRVTRACPCRATFLGPNAATRAASSSATARARGLCARWGDCHAGRSAHRSRRGGLSAAQPPRLRDASTGERVRGALTTAWATRSERPS